MEIKNYNILHHQKNLTFFLEFNLEPKSNFGIIVIQMNTLQSENFDDPDNEGSNNFSSTSFVLEFVHRQSAKKTTNAGPAITVEQKFKNLRHDLFTTLTILTPSRLKPLQLRK